MSPGAHALSSFPCLRSSMILGAHTLSFFPCLRSSVTFPCLYSSMSALVNTTPQPGRRSSGRHADGGSCYQPYQTSSLVHRLGPGGSGADCCQTRPRDDRLWGVKKSTAEERHSHPPS